MSQAGEKIKKVNWNIWLISRSIILISVSVKSMINIQINHCVNAEGEKVWWNLKLGQDCIKNIS